MSNLVKLSESNLDPLTQGQIGPVARKGRNTREQIAVLRALALYGLVPIEQLADVLEVEYQSAKKTVQILKARGDVSWCRWHDIDNDNTKRGPVNLLHILALTIRGHKRLTSLTNFPPDKPVITRRWKGESRKLPKMSHDRDVIIALSAFHKSVEGSDRFELLDSHIEPIKHKRDIEGKEKVFSVCTEIMPGGKTSIADAIVVMRNNVTGNVFTVFFEYENTQGRGDMAKRITNKLISYRTVFTHERRHFNQGQPLLFYVVSHKARVSEIFKLEKASPLLGVLRVAHIDDVVKDPLGNSWTRGVVEGGRFVLKPWSPLHG